MFKVRRQMAHSYLLGFIFLIFPIFGSFYGYYPLWTLGATALFAVSYYVMAFGKRLHPLVLGLFWFYSLAYVLGMSLAFQLGMAWFLFYHVNLLVWRFDDHYLSYRFISFALTTLVLTALGLLLGNDLQTRLMAVPLSVFIFGIYWLQKHLRIQEELRMEILEKNRTITLLSAENERHRISRDLHDSLGHTFAMMSLKTELALKQLKHEQLNALENNLQELHRISQDSMQDVRNLVNQLSYRTVIENLEEIERLFDLSAIDLVIRGKEDTENLSPVFQSAVGMIVKELANNVIKHSQAYHCEMAFSRQGERFVINCQDDGVGFEAVTGRELHSIRERLEGLNGEISILSGQNPTCIQVSLREGGAL